MQMMCWRAFGALTVVCVAWAMTLTAAAQKLVPLGRADTTCITRTRVVEGTTSEWCATALKNELDRLHAEGLADAEPVLVATANGRILRGASEATLTGRGRVAVTDGDLTCRSDYNSNKALPGIAMRIRCSDGRTGVAQRTWIFANQGEGTSRMSDGETARFAFGCSTRLGDVHTCPAVSAA